MSRLASAAAALHASIASVGGETVIYTRGTNYAKSFKMTAVAGHPQRLVDESAGGRLETEALDWTILVSDFVSKGSILPGEGDVRPEPGDRITRCDGSVYELADPAYRHADSVGARLRLHSVRIADDGFMKQEFPYFPS